MNARSLRTLVAVIAIGLGGSVFTGYVLSAHEWSIFEEGWVLLEDRAPDLEESMFGHADLSSQAIRFPEAEFWGGVR